MHNQHTSILRLGTVFCISILGISIFAPGSSFADPSAKVLSQGSRRLPGQYIVVYKDGFSPPEDDISISAGTKKKKKKFNKIINGYSAELSSTEVDQLKAQPEVAYIEEDAVIALDLPIEQSDVSTTSQSWGLDRIDQASLPLNQIYSYGATGKDVHAYIVDTGIRPTHSEFENRIGTSYGSFSPTDFIDCHSHGTHVAGTIGGKSYGVAKEVTLHAVKVLDCNGSGSTSTLLAGLDWVIQNAEKPAVVNLSIQAGFSQALNDAVNNVIKQGILTVIAAGNSSTDACSMSPSSTKSGLTVGATDITDQLAGFSNRGACVDILAPGVSIISAGIASDTAIATKSGTSMATPHATGVAALHLQLNPFLTPSSLITEIVNESAKDKISGLDAQTVNFLLQSDTNGLSGPCPTCKQINSQITTAGSSVILPSGDKTFQKGIKEVWMIGPVGTDFNLTLQKMKNNKWVTVAYSRTAKTSYEHLTYSSGTQGKYRMIVKSVSGTGKVVLLYR